MARSVGTQNYAVRKYIPRILGIVLLITTGAQAGDGARYLIIAHDTLYSVVRPLAEWKIKKGIETKLVRLSQIGTDTTRIKNFIANAYRTWQPRPEYLLLVGSPNLLPSLRRGNNYYTDNGYANLAGDYRAELAYGRLPAKNPRQCSTMVNKILHYERVPFLAESLWYKSGTMIIRPDGDAGDTVYWNDAGFLTELWRSAGYAQIETISTIFGDSAKDIVASVNRGCGFLVYRGSAVGNWRAPFTLNIDQLENGYKLPIVGSFTCATLTLTPNESMIGDAWLKAGTPQLPKGAVAFIGNSYTQHYTSRIRSAMMRGFFSGIFQESLTLGRAVLAGKENIYRLFANQKEYEGFNLFGDPEMYCWTDEPRSMQVFYDSVIPPAPIDFWVSVLEENGVPVANALVCLQKDSTVYVHGTTDENGLVALSVYPYEEGVMELTVTARNHVPYETKILVSAVGANEPASPRFRRRGLLSASPQSRNQVTVALEPCTAGMLSLRLYSADGRLSRTLFENRVDARSQTLKLNLSSVPAGTYFLKTDGVLQTRARLVIF